MSSAKLDGSATFEHAFPSGTARQSAFQTHNLVRNSAPLIAAENLMTETLKMQLTSRPSTLVSLKATAPPSATWIKATIS